MLALRLLGREPVDVTVVDRRNHHLFQPLLYQVATGMLSPGQIAPPIRHVVRRSDNVRVVLAEVTGFDLDARVVHASAPADLRPIELPYDSLIVAAGASQSYFGHDEFALHAPGMKTIDDALELRRRFFGAFEMAETATDPIERDRWLTIVVVGAGPTGVELAGQVRELATRSLRGEFRNVDPTSVRVLLLDGGDEPLATFGDRLSGKATKELERLGVELRMDSRVVGVDANGVDVLGKDGARTRIDAYTTVWAAGVQASPLAAKLAEASGATLDRAGRIAVADDLTIPGHPEVFAIGDMATAAWRPPCMATSATPGRLLRRHHVADREHLGMAGEREVGRTAMRPARSSVGAPGVGELGGQRRRLHSGGPHRGVGVDARVCRRRRRRRRPRWRRRRRPVPPCAARRRAARAPWSPCRRAGRRTSPAARSPPSSSSTRTDAGIDVRNSPRRQRVASSRTWPASSTPVGPGADDDDREPLVALDRVGRRLGHLERAEEAPAQLQGVVDRLHARRVEGELVVTEVRLAGAGGDDEAVVGDLDRARSAGAEAWTTRASRSKPVTSASSTRTLSERRTMWRIGGAIWPGDSMPVATWYSSGWNRWWLRRSTSVTSTGWPDRGAGSAGSPPKPAADDDDAVAERA